jgi:clan AA aspartic protease
MGSFAIEVTAKNLQHPRRQRTLSLLVDTGATYTTLPREVVEELGCQPIGRRRVLLADGREEEWPVGVILLVLEGQEAPTFCLLGLDGAAALLGAVTLEEFALGVDPVAKRLVPVRTYLTLTSRSTGPSRSSQSAPRSRQAGGQSWPSGSVREM